ncbi:hypothetical protein [Caenimonas aquaedulcis]|uniref:Uncharacterized protein n=1 Tax=Caenimonas aquaedulcis TaxID=2793270 RepID=A0A931MHY5_9BURK|nr:hypothetical protein [Caenimonas aquaedulcis]MBG9389283.1 hypothetical protein [Caenimonas aquaedulcis]
MQNRMPSRRRSPKMPHERDESAGTQDGTQARDEPSAARVGGAAHEDIERGQVDTDKGPVLDRTYDKVREGTPDPDKKFSP